ncbi:MAG: hypothetical protein B6240_01370 [Desulfobacteraceae bacterium 4572_87]|nr:MAG: hypothetical protein B6240_01370 [Desulfobacteraceae bacterium 4572_87]
MPSNFFSAGDFDVYIELMAEWCRKYKETQDKGQIGMLSPEFFEEIIIALFKAHVGTSAPITPGAISIMVSRLELQNTGPILS